MAQLEIFYFIFTFIIGILSLGFSIFFYSNEKRKDIEAFLWFYAAFTLMNMANFVSSYWRVNIPDYKGTFYSLLLYFENPVIFTVLMIAIPNFVHALLKLPDRTKRNKIFIFTGLAVFIIHNVFLFITVADNLTLYTTFLKNIIFIAILLYSFVIILQHTKGKEGNRFLQWAAYGWIFILIFAANDILLLNYTGIKFFPLIYAAAGAAFTLYFYKDTFHEKKRKQFIENPETLDTDTRIAAIAQEFGLSAREQEVIKLLTEGKSYKEISEELYISINTVKTHIRNIYPKMDITSRHEIVNIIHNTTTIK